MLRREYNNTEYTPSQINDAVERIVANDKLDYKIEGYNPDSVKLLCRTGYNWSIITEIMWDKADAAHLDILIECRNSNDNNAASQIQRDYEERHIDKVSNLFFKYINDPVVAVAKRVAPARWPVVVLGIVLIAAAAIIVYIFKSNPQ
jgi:hypothetical protein